MAWQPASGMGSNQGSGGNGGGDVPTGPSHGTEYTLQGVMRFLQTEWHRHERDRNSWEIERQEMRGRIAKLEGSSRKSDASNRALKKYVDILEIALKERDKLVKELRAGKDVAESIRVKKENASQVEKERQRYEKSQKSRGSFFDTSNVGEDFDEDPERGSLKSFLDKAQAEVSYLILSPSNPPPPRDLRDDILSQSFGVQPAPDHVYHQQVRQRNVYPSFHRSSPTTNYRPPPTPISITIREKESSSPSTAEKLPISHVSDQDWSPSYESRENLVSEQVMKIRHTFDRFGRETTYEEERTPEANGWDFNEADAFPEAKIRSETPDIDLIPAASNSPNSSKLCGSNRKKEPSSRKKCAEQDQFQSPEGCDFRVRFGLRGHLDVIRSVIFTGGGSPGEPEICTTGDDGTIKRWIIPARLESQGTSSNDMDVQSTFTHRGHTGSVMCLTSWSPSQNLSGAGRVQGDGWVFSGGQDATIRVWERGRVDPKATIDGHTDAVWTVCVLPGTVGNVLGPNKTTYGEPNRILLASGSADGTVKVWSVSVPLQSLASRLGSRRGSRVRGNSISSGSGLSSSPQPSVGSSSPFHYTLIHSISRANCLISPTSITTISTSETAFAVSYVDAAILVFDTKTGEEIGAMASQETYDKTQATGVNAIVASANQLDGPICVDSGQNLSENENIVLGATGSRNGVEGVIISGHEDRIIRFYDANSGQCIYNILAHPAAIAALALSPDGRELVSAGHDASLRFWSLEKRSCTQEITSHRLMRGEGVCSVSWSRDGRWVISGGGDGVVKVFSR